VRVSVAFRTRGSFVFPRLRREATTARKAAALATLQVAALLRGADPSVALFDAMLADGVLDFDAVRAEARPQLVVFCGTTTTS
jgi:hypothetical protein